MTWNLPTFGKSDFWIKFRLKFNLCASRRRTLRGSFFAKKSVLKLGIVDFLDFNKKCQILIIPVDLGLCTGYNLCASRRRTLRGLFFTKKSVLKLEIVDFLDFIKKCQILIFPGVRRRRRRRHTWLSPSPHPITPRKKTRREAGILT